ncbi:PAS domain S-box protein [Psychrobium sp. MM17-31]|uniref:PAS domain S-box protein n=1 Tax=Psychrobium sp. MM17-31 TaxID=2917758 RepID=UPI001EF5A1EA|nr:PAS domain S-box protein [Psychrobium sp. MM17-31]MCG7531405.1 PAS domain S-box protein [Psychrobium sp. MM17-31]
MKINLLSNYNKTVLYTYFAVLAMAVITSLWVLGNNRKEALSERFTQIQAHEHQVELLLDSGVRAVTSLNQYATKHLSLAEAPRIELLLSYYYYSYNSIDRVFEIVPNIQEDLQDKFQFEVGLISGFGNLENRSDQYYREMDMIFEMNLSFPVAMEMVPDATRVYYLSANEFIGIYPWPGDDYAFNKATLKSPAYLASQKSANPQGKIYWTDVYADEVGKGLMTTVGSPLYIGDQYYGALAIDITLSSLSKELLPQGGLNGHMILVDGKNNVMAHSEVQKNQVTQSIEHLKTHLPPELQKLGSEKLFSLTKGQLLNGYYVQTVELVNAPFKLVYYEKETDLFADSWRQFVVSLVSITLALSILLSVVHWLAKQSFIGPASRLMVHLENCAKEPISPPSNTSSAWLPFFSLISKTFSENKTYTQQLAEDNRQLDIQVAQRTESLRQTTKQREQEYSLLRALIDSIPDVIFYKNTQGQYLGCNKAAQELFGAGESDIIGRNSEDFLTPELSEKLQLNDQKVIKGRSTVTIQQEMVLNEQPKLLETLKTPYTDLDGELLGLIGIARDITKEHEAAEKLRYSEERYALAMAAVEEGLWDWHINTDQLHCNSAYFTMLGYEPSQVLPSWEGFRKLVHPDDWKCVQGKLNEHVKNPLEPYEHEFRMQAANGDYEWILSRGSVVEYDEDNQPTRVLGTHKNITKRKEHEREIIEAKQDAELANRYKSEFLANMSHEIRTPMNGIMGMIQLALRTDLDNQQHDYLDKAFNSANSLLLIINDILDFSKIEAGKLELESVPFNLEDVLDAVINVNVIAAQKKGLEFVLNAPTVPLRVVGDGLRLNQVLTNIVSNAVKFTNNGYVEFRCDLLEQAKDKARLKFSVTDSGIGIEQDKLGNLFKAFSQADGSITREFGGSGLGLSISQHLVRMMGGEFDVTSEINRGSCFSFTIDIDLDSEQTQQQWQLPQSVDGANMLMVANNQQANASYHDMLPELGFALTQVDTLDDALAQRDEPQVILIDWVQESDTEKLAKLAEQFSDAMIFMMVNYGDDVMKQPVIKDVARGIFSKPLTPAHMTGRIGRTLKSRPKQPQPVEEKPAKGRLLLVDDNAINQQVAKGLLESQGYEVELADNGQLAVDAALSKSYELVLMDIQMPVMDGLAAAKKIRETYSDKQLPIIAMTAHAMTGDKEKSLAAGMNAHITKPLVLKEMFDTISECIQYKNSEG